MKYLLMIYADEKAYQARSPEERQRGYQAYMAYSEALKKAGAYVASDRLQPTATATTVRVVDGKTQVLNGPYTETKEQLGGFFMIEAPDLDAALAWAARCPGAQHGVMEVRPVWTM
ncbi:MAG TPA: YciI family protein [Steroidobacteraceae bacterium]|nr:YciI family protein [Steroidobacteraceae bacterium]